MSIGQFFALFLTLTFHIAVVLIAISFVKIAFYPEKKP